MAGDQRRHQLVAQLLRAHRRAVLVAGAQQHRRARPRRVAGRVPAALTIGALLAAPLRSAISSKISLSTCCRRAIGPNLAPIQAIGPRPLSRSAGAAAATAGSSANARISPSSSRSASSWAPWLQAEDGSQDDLERQPLQPGVKCDRLIARPGGELALRQLAHQARPGPASARRGTLAASACAAPCGSPRRAGSPSGDPRSVRGCALPRRGARRRAPRGTAALISSGSLEHHERRLAEHADREARAVARPGALQEGGGASSSSRASATLTGMRGPGGSWLFMARLLTLEFLLDEYIYLEVCVKLMPRGHFDRSARRAQTRARLLQAAAEVYARQASPGRPSMRSPRRLT